MITEQELIAARLAVNDWHACATQEELERWRAAQTRLINAAQASVSRELEAVRAERDALKAQLREVKNWAGALEDAMNPQDVADIDARLKREA